MQPDDQSFIHWFRNSAPYINAFRGRIFVISFGAEAIDGPEFPHLVHDLALLSSLGVRLVLAYGARARIERELQQRGIRSRYHKGLRITDRQALQCVKLAVGDLRLDIEALLSMGLPNSPMAGAGIRIVSGNFITARPLGIEEGIDYCHTGELRRIDAAAITAQLDGGNIVLLPPLGYSSTGELFNLSAEQVACHAAQALGADKLIYLLEAPGLQDSGGGLIRELTAGEAERYLSGGERIPAAVAAPLANAVTACRNGVRRVHLIDGRRDGALLQELFTRDGSGTLLTLERFEGIRPATIEDVGGILELITPLEEAGMLVRRSRDRLEVEIERFCVIERDGAIIACAALYPFPAERAAELAALAVDPSYRGEQRGTRLLEFMERRAAGMDIEQLFVLTTHTTHWFREHGFQEGEIESLPVERRALYNYQRNSRVLIKRLGG